MKPQPASPQPAPISTPAQDLIFSPQEPVVPDAVPAISRARPSLAARLRAGARFVNCSRPLPTGAQRWRARYQKHPDATAAAFDAAMPAVDYVLGRLERAGLPSEFAMLPMVESNYSARAGTLARAPTGYWQFMPLTARHYGVLLSPGYDGRRDLVVSTRAAVHLLQDLAKRFHGDWELVTLAYNAGEFRVRGALRKRGGDSRPLSALPLSPISHAHLDKLKALTCLAMEHAAYQADVDDLRRLRAVRLPFPVDAALLAGLAGLSQDGLRPYVAAANGPTIPAQKLLLPQPHAKQLAQALADWRATDVVGWRPDIPRRGDTWESLATQAGLPHDRYAQLHGKQLHEPLPATVLRRGPKRGAVAAAPRPGGDYVVRAGDSLWRIARILGMSMAELHSLNPGIEGRLLRPGQRLRTAPAAAR